MTILAEMYKELEEVFPEMVEIRRDLHRHPELSFEEVRTPELIAKFLTELGLEVKTGVGGRGVTGLLRGGKKGPTIALRADFDALPIQDEKDVPYKSTVPGVMHACGHDGHTATLLGVAKVLSKYQKEIEGNIVFIHQFAEELAPGGAKPMIADGCLEGVDVIFGAHLQSTAPYGEVLYREGYALAAADLFRIKVQGKGGHGAYPHLTVDPLVTASQLVINLQQIVSRKVDPQNAAVLTVGSLHSGEASNVIPDTAEILGTVRTYAPEARDLIEEQIAGVAQSTCEATGATCEVSYERGYDALWNHPKETRYIQQIATEIVGEEKVKERPAVMGGEDFSYFLQHVPGTFFFLGAHPSDSEIVYPHHHPMFDFDERAMLIAAKVFVSSVFNYNKSFSKAEELQVKA